MKRAHLVAALVLVGGLVHTPAHVRAQAPAIPGEPVDLADRVVAVVGDSVILLSEIQREILLMEQRGTELPTEPEARRESMREVLENLIDLQLVLQEAARDTTLIPSADLIDSRVETYVENVQSELGGAAALQTALAQDGITLTRYRQELRGQIQRQQIQQLFLQRRLAQAPPVVVTEAELRELFESQREQFQERPALYTLEQILLRPSPPDSAWTRARTLADSLAAELRAGADFAELAAEHSDDPGSAQSGGDLGWFRRGNMVREFEDVAFRLPDQQVSDPVRSTYGWHVIRVDRSRPGEVKARHILVRPEAGPDDLRRARELAAALADSVRAGTPVNELNERHGEEDGSSRIQVSREQIDDELPDGYATALADVEEGQVVEPFEIQLGPASVLAIVKVAEVREAGDFVFEDLRDQIRLRLQEQKKIERLREQLRAAAYIDIRF
jgi:peptidyl-prolyl cis-trans isomerase SurA